MWRKCKNYIKLNLALIPTYIAEVVPLQSVDIEEEDIEAEFQKLEKELEEAAPEPEAREPMAKQGEEAGPQQSVDSLSDNLSNLHLEAA